LRELRAKHEASLGQRPPDGMSRAQHRERTHKRFFRDFDQALDQCREIDWLSKPAIAAVVRGSLYHYDGSRYHLFAYCIMPNHVHVLFQPREKAVEETAGEETIGERPDARSPLAKLK